MDWMTVGLFLLLAVFGWLNVYEASYTYDQASIFDFSFWNLSRRKRRTITKR